MSGTWDLEQYFRRRSHLCVSMSHRNLTHQHKWNGLHATITLVTYIIVGHTVLHEDQSNSWRQWLNRKVTEANFFFNELISLAFVRLSGAWNLFTEINFSGLKMTEIIYKIIIHSYIYVLNLNSSTDCAAVEKKKKTITRSHARFFLPHSICAKAIVERHETDRRINWQRVVHVIYCVNTTSQRFNFSWKFKQFEDFTKNRIKHLKSDSCNPMATSANRIIESIINNDGTHSIHC